MANEALEMSPFGNFSIENSGSGNTQLLGEFFDETPKNPEEITKVIPKKETSVKKEEKIEEVKTLEEALLEDEDEEEKPKKVLKDPLKSKEAPTNEDENEDEENTSEDDKFSALSKDLKELGVFTTDEDEEEIVIKTPKDFLDRFQYEAAKKADERIVNFISQFGEDYQKAFEAIYVNKVDPKTYFSTLNEIQDFSSLDLTKESNQELVVRQGLQQQGLKPEQVTAKLEKIKSYGDLEEEAGVFHELLIAKQTEKLSKIEEESKNKVQAQIQSKKIFAQNVQNILQEKLKTKELDGLPLNPKLVTELQDYLLTEKWKTPAGETLTDFDKSILELKKPENHQLKIKFALLLKTLEKDPTLSTIQQIGSTKKAEQLFKETIKVKNPIKQEAPKSFFSNK